MGRIQLTHSHEDIISVENLLAAWREFVKGKRNKRDVQVFHYHLTDNILDLHYDLRDKTYRHGPYKHFKITDPKSRHIHKARVRDRLLHHAVHRTLYPFFDRKFINDSYACRTGKGMHKALNRFRAYARKVSKNNTRQCWVLKCDIRKFFASIEHSILLSLLARDVPDRNIVCLLENIISSFPPEKSGTGLPLGNLTSQLFANVYLNELDQFVKHKLQMKYYVRYADDFVVLSDDKQELTEAVAAIERFLSGQLLLQLHPDKVFVKTLASGIDFLGWVHFSDHRVLRTTTKRRIFRGVAKARAQRETVRSYLGMLRHGNAWKLRYKMEALVQEIENRQNH